MSRISRLAFLLFYIACIYAVNQERIRITTFVLEQSSGGDRAYTDDGRERVRDNFPKFREARPRVICELFLASQASLDLHPQVSEHSLFPQVHSLKPLDSLDDDSSRAPPFQS
jgi:hypothetical protein